MPRTGPFWNGLFQAMMHYRGNLVGVITELSRREMRFNDRFIPPPDQPSPPRTYEAVRHYLGFHIGEPPAIPGLPPGTPHPALLAGTGPP